MTPSCGLTTSPSSSAAATPSSAAVPCKWRCSTEAASSSSTCLLPSPITSTTFKAPGLLLKADSSNRATNQQQFSPLNRSDLTYSSHLITASCLLTVPLFRYYYTTVLIRHGSLLSALSLLSRFENTLTAVFFDSRFIFPSCSLGIRMLVYGTAFTGSRHQDWRS